jgi:ParB-like chromosome segregation protein Spo0J
MDEQKSSEIKKVKVSELKVGDYQVWSKMTEEKFNQFLNDVKENGVEDVIHVDEDLTIIDGHHRYDCCLKLGIEEIEVKIHYGLTDEEKLGKAHRLNTLSREIGREEKIQRAVELRKEGRSHNQIADWLGVNQSTITRWLSAYVTAYPEKTTGNDGKQYDTKRKSDEEITERRDKVKRDREEGKRITEIAEEIGVSVGTVHSDIKAIEKSEKQAEKEKEEKKRKQALDLLEIEAQLNEETSPQIREDEPMTSPDNMIIDARKTAQSHAIKTTGIFSTLGVASESVKISYLKQVKSAVEAGLITLGQYADEEEDRDIIVLCLELLKKYNVNKEEM